MRRVALALLTLVACKRTDPPAPAAAASIASASPSAIVETPPRCHAEGASLALAGEEVRVGDAAVMSDALLVGIVRREGGKRIAGVLRASLDLATSKMIDIGPSLGEDPPPVPRVHDGVAFVAYYTHKPGTEVGKPGATRELHVARLDANGLGKIEGTAIQQADESTAFDLAWPAGDGPPLLAWDEDAPIPEGQLVPERGQVRVQILGEADKPRVASAYPSDTESPKLMARAGGGWWLAWLARRSEGEDAGSALEGPGESRAFRWIEVASVDAKGAVSSKVRRISPEKGRVSSFELAKPQDGAVEIVVVVQDEAAHVDGAGGRIVRYAVTGDRIETSELADGGVGHAPIAVVRGDGTPRWIAWTDVGDHAHVLPLGPLVLSAAHESIEPTLAGNGVVAAIGPDALVTIASADDGHLALRRSICR